MSASRKLRKRRGPKPLGNRCSFKGCKRRSKSTRECLTCEQTGRPVVFTRHACAYHQEEILAEVKSHALRAHPFNIVRATIAALKGE